MAALGTRVVIVDKSPAGQGVADGIESTGGEARFIQCDLSAVDDLEAMIPRSIEAFGPIDILVNSALHATVAPVVSFDLAEWEETFATNARAPFLLIKNLLPGMLESAARSHRQPDRVRRFAPRHCVFRHQDGTSINRRFTVAREIGNDAGVAVFSFVPGIVDTPLIHEILVPPISKLLGVSSEQAAAALAQNPGYDGLMPVSHCATTLVDAIIHAPEHHGQVASPFDPLDRIGVIRMPSVDPDAASAVLDVSDPRSGLYIQQYLGDVTTRTRGVEERVALRTRELEAARRRSDTLLLNILPRRSPNGSRRRQPRSPTASPRSRCSSPTSSASRRSRAAHAGAGRRRARTRIFSAFDELAEALGLEKIKTIGDCYMAVAGLPRAPRRSRERVAEWPSGCALRWLA